MRNRDFEHIGICALFGIALLTPTTPMALERGTPATLQSEVSSPTVSGAKPSDFESVLISPLKVKYTANFLSDGNRRGQRIEGKDLDRIRRHFRETVTARLAAAYPIASEPGPRVLRIDSVLFDPVLDKRNWLVPTRVVFRGVPRVQLVALLRDSQTGEVVDLIGLTLRPHANRLMKESPGFYWQFMRRVFDRIGTRVRWSLEDSAGAASS